MFRERVLRVASLLAVAAVVIVGMPGTVYAQPSTYTDWTGTNGNWTDSTWDAGNPNVTSGEQVWSSQGQITVNTPNASCSNLWLGESGPTYWYNSNNPLWFGTSAGTASLVVASGGVLTVSGNIKIGYAGQGYGLPPVLSGAVGCGTLQDGGAINLADGSTFAVGAWGGTGTMTQTGGTLTEAGGASGQYYVGVYGTGTYNMSGGLWSNAPWVSIGYGGASYWCAVPASKVGIPAIAAMNQTGGTVQVNANEAVVVGKGYDNGSTGVWNISGSAALNTPWLILGAIDGGGGGFVAPGGSNNNAVYPNGTFNQTGGVVTVTSEMILGMDQTMGTLFGWPANYAGSGAKGTGTYNFYGGTLTDSGSGANLVVRLDAPATGTFQGYGKVSFSGTLTNNGRIIADGGVLDMSSFSAVANTVTNVAANGSTTNGWFAKNGGELILPPVPVTGNGTYVWGGDISLVHSVQLVFHGVSGSGNFSVNLLDAANAQAPSTAGLGTITGLWDIIPSSLSYSAFDATFRYDDALAGVNEASARLFEYSGGQWDLISNAPDTIDHLISAVGLSGSGCFAATAGPTTAKWAVNGNGTWSGAANWSGNNVPGAIAQDTAVFGTVLTGGVATVTLNGSRTLGNLGFSTTAAGASYLISGASTLTLANSTAGMAMLSDSGGNHTIAAPVMLGNNLNVTAAAGSTLTVSGAIGELNPGTTLSLSGGGTLVISGSTTYSGATTVNSSTLQIGGSGITNGFALASPSITMSNNAAVAFNPTAPVSFGGVVSGSGQLIKLGTSNLDISGTSTYSGPTTISAGTVELDGNGNNLPLTTALTIASSGVLDMAGVPQTVGSLSGSAGAVVTNQYTEYSVPTLTVAMSAGATSFAGNIIGRNALALSGSGKLTLGGTNTYYGGTTVSGGTLDIAAPSALSGSGLVTIAAGGRLVLGSGAGIGALLTASSPISSGAVGLSAAASVPATLGGSESGSGNMAALSGAAASSQGGGGSVVGGAAAVPEPGTIALLAAGAIVFAAVAARRKQR